MLSQTLVSLLLVELLAPFILVVSLLCVCMLVVVNLWAMSSPFHMSTSLLQLVHQF